MQRFESKNVIALDGNRQANTSPRTYGSCVDSQVLSIPILPIASSSCFEHFCVDQRCLHLDTSNNYHVCCVLRC